MHCSLEGESEAEEGQRALLEQVSEQIEIAKETIDTYTELKPYKILGIPAQSAMTASIASTALSFYVAILSLYSSSQSDSSTISQLE